MRQLNVTLKIILRLYSYLIFRYDKLELNTFWITYLLSRYFYDHEKLKRKDYFIWNDVVFVNDRNNPLRVFIHTHPNVK